MVYNYVGTEIINGPAKVSFLNQQEERLLKEEVEREIIQPKIEHAKSPQNNKPSEMKGKQDRARATGELIRSLQASREILEDRANLIIGAGLDQDKVYQQVTTKIQELKAGIERLAKTTRTSSKRTKTVEIRRAFCVCRGSNSEES